MTGQGTWRVRPGTLMHRILAAGCAEPLPRSELVIRAGTDQGRTVGRYLAEFVEHDLMTVTGAGRAARYSLTRWGEELLDELFQKQHGGLA